MPKYQIYKECCIDYKLGEVSFVVREVWASDLHVYLQ